LNPISTHNALPPPSRPTALLPPRGKVTTWTYDVEGRMRTKKYHGQTFANLEYTYNANSQVATRKFWSNGSTSRAIPVTDFFDSVFSAKLASHGFWRTGRSAVVIVGRTDRGRTAGTD
jgi:hypothetical protein